MILAWNETQTILRKGRAALLFSTRLPLLDGVPESIQACYERAAKGLKTYATDTFLPHIEQKMAQEPRRNRLHATLPSVRLQCEGEVVDGRWITLTLTLRCEEDGVVTEQQDRRVWDGHTGLLCPLEFFLSRKEAKKYSRWSLFLQGDTVGVISAKKDKRDRTSSLQIARSSKKLPPLS